MFIDVSMITLRKPCVLVGFRMKSLRKPVVFIDFCMKTHKNEGRSDFSFSRPARRSVLSGSGSGSDNAPGLQDIYSLEERVRHR